MDLNQYSDMNIDTLRELAIARGLAVNNTMSRNELIVLLTNNDQQPIMPDVNPWFQPENFESLPSIYPNLPKPIARRLTQDEFKIHKRPRVMSTSALNIFNKLSQSDYPIYLTVKKQFAPVISEVTPKNIASIFYTAQFIEINGNTFYIMGFLMCYTSDQFITALAYELGFKYTSAPIDVFINLLYYLNCAADPFLSNITDSDIAYISKSEQKELLDILGPKYQGPHDKASLIFAAVSGKSVPLPDVTETGRYLQLAEYSRITIWNLAVAADIITFSGWEPYSPYVFITLNMAPELDSIVVDLNEENIDALMNKYGILYPEIDVPDNYVDKNGYFCQEIIGYHVILTRPSDIKLPDIIEDISDLGYFTLKELNAKYDGIYGWDSRNDFINKLAEEYNRGPVWRLIHEHCNNDDTKNAFMQIDHGEMDKNDISDPTLSYGYPGNYRCYQVNELIGSWTFYQDDETGENVFKFIVPDWQHPNEKQGRSVIMDRTTGQPLSREFPIASMRQLLELLIVSGIAIELIEKIKIGLEANSEALKLINKLFEEYLQSEYKDEINLYLVWLFFFGIWMRFWKGPGYDWPNRWLESQILEGSENINCSESDRQFHTMIQGDVRNKMFANFNVNLQTWLNNLPIVHYNLSTGDVNVAQNAKIVNIVDKSIGADFCLAQSGDLVWLTGFYLITKFLEIDNKEDFTRFIQSKLSELLILEKAALDDLKEEVNDPLMNEVIEQRYQDLSHGVPQLSTFNPFTVESSQHIDPEHGEMIFEY